MNKFAALLVKSKTTIYRVSKDTETPYTTLWEWQHGKTVPRAKTVLKIADYFGVEIGELIDD